MHYLDDAHILLFLTQIFVLLLCARGLGELFSRWKQPAMTAELLVGIVLGPTVLGRLAPGLFGQLFPADPLQRNMLETVAWVGVLFLLLDTGLEIDFSIAWRQRGQALAIAGLDIVVPLAVALTAMVWVPGDYLVDPTRRLTFGLFMATVMTISAMPVAARTLHDLNLLKTDLGFLTMSALAVNDIIGWVLFTIILGLFSQASVEAGPILAVFATTVGFAALALTAGRRLSSRALAAVHRAGLREPAASLTLTCLTGFLFGAVTQKLGVHALFGFFIAGVVIGEAKNLSEQTRGIISQMVHAVFVPLFFVNIGLKIDFAAGFALPLVLLVTAVGIGGRYLGAWLGVTASRVPRVNRDLIAIAHTPGGMMEIVVGLVALEAGLITQPVFVAIVFSAVASSVLMGPWMARALARRRRVRTADFLAAETVLPALAAREREAAVHELAAAAAAALRGADAAAVAAAALAREREFGTAIGSGVAIPHARMGAATNPVLAYARSAEGIEWDAPDGAPVHHVFFLLTPAGTEDLHVQILSHIARVMSDAAGRGQLEAAPDGETLLTTLQEHLGRVG